MEKLQSAKKDYIIDSVTHKNISSLQYHYLKHGKEFGDIIQAQYMKKAKEFASKPVTKSMQEIQVGNIVIRHDNSTGEIFIEHAKKREMRTYYIDDGRDKNAFTAAVELAKRLQ